jgi:hypothetical protein
VKGDQQIVWYIAIFNVKMAMKKKKSFKVSKKNLKLAQNRQKKKKVQQKAVNRMRLTTNRP